MAEARNQGGFGKILFLFGGFSLFLLSFAFHHSFQRFEAALQKGRVDALERKLDTAVARTHGDFYLMSAIEGLMKALLRDGPRGSSFDAALQSLAERWQIAIRLYVYESFSPVYKFPSTAPDEQFFGKILKGISLSGSEFKQARIELREDIERVFGPGQRLDLLKRKNFLFGNMSGDTRDSYFLGNFPGGRSVFLRVTAFPDESGRFRLMPDAERQDLGLAIPEKWLWIPPAGMRPEDMQIAWRKFQSENQAMIRSGDFEWSFCRSPFGLMWCARARVDPRSGEVLLFWAILAGYGLAAVFLLMFVLSALETRIGLAAIRPLNSLSIRIQFMGLFLMASLIPLGIALLLGALSYFDQQEIQTGKATQEAAKQILRLERCYHSVIAEFRRFCTEFSANPLVRSGNLDALASQVQTLVDQEIIQHFELRDGSANILSSTWDPRIHGSPWATEIFSKTAIRRHAPNRIGESLKKISGQDIMAESLMASADPAMTAPLRFPGKVWVMGMGGGSPAISYWNVYNDLATGPAFVFMVHQLGWQYLKKVKALAEESQKKDAGSLFTLFFGWRQDTFLSLFPKLSGPDVPDLLNACMRAKETGQSFTRLARVNGGLYWASIKLNLALSPIVMVHLLSADSLTRSLSPLHWKLGLSVLVAMLLTILGSKILSDLFIVPIADLQGGIVGIRDRNPEYRIPLRRDDEFGIVVSAFTQFLADLKEMQSGRLVQESLLPKTSSAPAGYDIQFFRTPATELAGDYHDTFPLADGRWVVIIGDVTGHGISAAMPMAMAKATIEYQKIAGWEYPTKVTEQINALFFAQLKPSRKYMTIQTLVLNPQTHQMIVENGGHGFPLHFQKATGKCTVPSLGAPPIGFKLNWAPAKTTLELAPGDAVLVYTDGYTECANAEGLFMEDTGLTTHFEHLMCQERSIKDILDELMRILEAFKAPGPYQDDITIVIIKRND